MRKKSTVATEQHSAVKWVNVVIFYCITRLFGVPGNTLCLYDKQFTHMQPMSRLMAQNDTGAVENALATEADSPVTYWVGPLVKNHLLLGLHYIAKHL